MEKISIREVAKLAGVSPTTVSRVINNSDHPVSDETRKRVEKAVDELNFEPNRMARALSSKKSNIIGVIVHDITDDYFSEMLKGIESVIYREDFFISIYNTYRDVKRELRAVNMLRASRAEAVIFAGGSFLDEKYEEDITPLLEDMKSSGTVIVGVTEHPSADINFNVGNLSAAKQITEYLFAKGHRDIAYLSGPEKLNTSYHRYKGFLQAFNKNGYKFNYKYMYQSDFSFEGGRKAALEIIKKINDITAVVSANDEMALGLIWELKNQGYRVPDDISVVGIGDIPSARFSYPPLTTLSLPIYRIGTVIGRYIMKALKGEDREITLFDDSLELKERESVLEREDNI